VIAEYGADAFRMYEMFMGPFDQSISWNTNGLKGVKKFLDKVIALWDKVEKSCGDNDLSCSNVSRRDGSINRPNNTDNNRSRDKACPCPNGEAVITPTNGKAVITPTNGEAVITPKEVETLLHQTIKKTTEDIDAFRFNTTISQFMIFVNKLSELDNISPQLFETFIILLAPFAPHLAEEFWQKLGKEFSIFTTAKRPNYDEKKLTSDMVPLAIQFNGKVRGTVEVSPTASQEEVLEKLKGVEKLAEYLTSGTVKKVIYVPGKIMNVVMG
jgi:leucyl-tRNA synthetase